MVIYLVERKAFRDLAEKVAFRIIFTQCYLRDLGFEFFPGKSLGDLLAAGKENSAADHETFIDGVEQKIRKIVKFQG